MIHEKLMLYEKAEEEKSGRTSELGISGLRGENEKRNSREIGNREERVLESFCLFPGKLKKEKLGREIRERELDTRSVGKGAGK